MGQKATDDVARDRILSGRFADLIVGRPATPRLIAIVCGEGKTK